MRFALALFLFPLLAFGIDTPLRNPALLQRPEKEAMVRVSSARVVIADYGLIQRDFAETRNMSHPEIDAWLLDHAAYVSKPQAAQATVNTTIATNGKEVVAYRPADYGRASVFSAGTGLIDAKGTGAPFPRQYDHGNGLATLGESIREFVYEKLIHQVTEHAGLDVDTVGCYAIFDLGFDVKHADGSTSPAGMILRQAHERSAGAYSLYDETKARQIEKELRRYGLTSAGAYRHQSVEQLNIQGTKDGHGLIDFGGYLTVEKFEKPARNFYDHAPLFEPGTPGFVQPDPERQIPFELWGYTHSGKADPKLDNPWVWSHELATNLRNGTATRENVEQHIHNLLDRVERQLALVPAKPRPVSCPSTFAKLGGWLQEIK
jgi:hypothetical protein